LKLTLTKPQRVLACQLEVQIERVDGSEATVLIRILTNAAWGKE